MKRYTEQAFTRLPEKVNNAVSKHAKRANQHRSEWIREAIMEKLEKEAGK